MNVLSQTIIRNGIGAIIPYLEYYRFEIMAQYSLFTFAVAISFNI
jgi:hypothetical protein